MPRKKPVPLRARIEALEKRLQRETARRKRAEQALAETLDRQRATSAILQVISRSLTDVQSVFDAIVQLLLARKFVELHGGRLWLKSQVGVGSTFTLPLVTS